MQESEELTAEILTPSLPQAPSGYTDSFRPTIMMRLEQQTVEGADQNKELLEQLQRDYIFQKEPQSKKRITPLLKKEVKWHQQYRISQRLPINVLPLDKKRELDKLTLERQLRMANQKRFLVAPMQIGQPIRCLIRKDRAGVFELGTTYRLLQQRDSKFLMAAKKEIGTNTTYIISTNAKSICDSDNKYRGKVSSNFLRKEWIIYDDGFNPAKVRELSECRQQLGYVNYEKKMFSGQPRSLRVVIPALDQNLSPRPFRPLESRNELKQSLENNPSLVLKFESSKPKEIGDSGCYRLNFQGRITDESDQKNFILVGEAGEEALAVGKYSNQDYFMEVRHPFSLFQAFAIALTNLDTKLFVD